MKLLLQQTPGLLGNHLAKTPITASEWGTMEMRNKVFSKVSAKEMDTSGNQFSDLVTLSFTGRILTWTWIHTSKNPPFSTWNFNNFWHRFNGWKLDSDWRGRLQEKLSWGGVILERQLIELPDCDYDKFLAQIFILLCMWFHTEICINVSWLYHNLFRKLFKKGRHKNSVGFFLLYCSSRSWVLHYSSSWRGKSGTALRNQKSGSLWKCVQRLLLERRRHCFFDENNVDCNWCNCSKWQRKLREK